MKSSNGKFQRANACWEDYEMQEKERKTATVCRVSTCQEAVRVCVEVGGKCALQVVVSGCCGVAADTMPVLQH